MIFSVNSLVNKISHLKYLKTSGIYAVINKINGKIYIGQAYSLYNRCTKHRNGASNAPKLSSAIKKYGIENFEFKVLEECEKVKLNEREEYWILLYGTLNPEKGYNLIQRQDTKRIPCSEETKTKISEGLKRTFPDGRNGGNNPFFGKKHSKLTKEAISRTKKSMKLKSHRRRKIIKIDLNGNEFEYESIKDGANSVCGYATQIHTAIKNNKPYKKCFWRKF